MNKTKSEKGYLRFLTGQIISLLGSEIVGFVLGVYLAQQYGNAFFFAISMILQFLPRVIVSPIAGVWADKRNRKRIVISSDLVQAVITTCLVALFNLNRIFTWTFWAVGEIWIIFGFILLRSIFQAIQGPSVSSILPSIVPPEKLSRLNGLLQFAMGIIGLIAPIVSAVLINYWKVYNLLWIDSITFIIALLFILTVHIPSTPRSVQDEQISPIQEKRLKKFARDFSAGIFVTKEIEGLSSLLAVFVLANILVTPINILSELLVLQIHGGSITDLALISVAFSVGMIGGSLISSIVKSWKYLIATMFIGIIGLYTGLLVVGIAPIGNFWVIAVGGFITTFGIPIFSTIAVTMIQLIVPNEKMGRFSGFMSALTSIFTPIGYLISGALAQIIYIPFVLIGASVLAIIVMILMWSFSQIRRLEPQVKEKLALAKIKAEQKRTSQSQDDIGAIVEN
ncbi:MAG: MFS transporter [Candidatus Lokiarchaeota archaeon]|nr:MFS transporter [Candidatus Lokiarchaeota archaeon]